jgi:predicted nucleic acid-binding protein
MIVAELVVDTNIVSYLHRGDVLGDAYLALINGRPAGVTLLTLEELHYGINLARWGQKQRCRLDAVLGTFFVMQAPAMIAEICGSLRAERERIGLPIELGDAWIAATALWYDLPLVTHDRDLEAIPGLRVLTLHEGWRLRDSAAAHYSTALTLGRSEFPQHAT